MRKYVKQSVPYNEHPVVGPVESLNWENIRVFLAVERHGSFRGAARELGMSLNTVRRHVELLEHEVNSPLLLRSVKGVSMTAEGKRFYGAARQMEHASFGVKRIAQSDIADFSGRVRISVSEGIGTFWVMPQLVEFQRTQPKIIVELNCTMRLPNLLSMEADLAIQLVRPINPDLNLVKLGRMHVMPFASKEYLKLFGRPHSIQDVMNHKIVEQLSPQIDVDAVDRLFPNWPREGFVAVATNTSTAHYWAVARGAGLGMLPTYLLAFGAGVEPVDLDLHVHHDIWMAYHPDAKKLKRVAATIEWLKQAFNPRRFPWFRDEFIHPRNFSETIPGEARVNRFDPNTTI